MDEKNRNYKRIDKLIIDSFIYLAKKEKAERVTVSAICQKADINRTTFYNHYKDIWEIIEVIENGIISQVNDVLKDFHYKTFIEDPYPTLSRLNKIILEKPEYYQKLFELSESRFFIDKLKDIFRDKIVHDTDLPSSIKLNNDSSVFASFFVGGLANLYFDWFSGKVNTSLDSRVKSLSESLKRMAVQK